MAILELTDKKIVEKLPKKKKGKEKEAQAPEAKKAVKTEAHEEARKTLEVKKEVKKDDLKIIKPMSKAKPSFDDEKRAEKAKSEERKMSGQKGFMKNLRGLFRKRGDR
jgi:hypothetical protein